MSKDRPKGLRTEKLQKLYNDRFANNRVFRFLDMASAVMLALCPLLQHYIGPLYNAGISVLCIIAVYLLYRMIPDFLDFKFTKISFVLIMIVYQTYRIANHGTTVTEFGQSAVFIIFMVALGFGKVDVRTVVRCGRIVALVASACVLIQYVCFYGFGFHLQMAPTALFIPAAEQWRLGALTGLAGVTGRLGNFYRPSAFFLEPSHVYIYMFPHLILLLFEGKLDKKALLMAILISVGIVATTSGMGIAAVLGIWGLFLILRDERDGTFHIKNVLRRRNLIAVAILVVLFLVAAQTVPFLQRAIKRIFVPGRTGSTAISGRTAKALQTILAMSPKQWILGVADNTHGISFTFPGLLDVLFRHGLVGMVLSYELYVKCIWKMKLPYKFIGAVILITSLFSAHTHSTIGMLNFLIILMCGVQTEQEGFYGIRLYSAPGKEQS